MVSLKSLALTAVLAASSVASAHAGETVLLYFTASWCGPCQTMKSTVDQLAGQGFPIRKVDFDQNRELAKRYQVSSIPCFVMVVDGKEVDRVVGLTSSSRLEQMLARANVRRPGESAGERPVVALGQSPDTAVANQPPAAQQPPGANSTPTVQDRTQVTPAATAAPAANRGLSSSERMIRSAVRIKVEDSSGHSFGTGTIVDAREGEALVLTCGHIFRDSQGKGPITVDLFDGANHVSVPGSLISFDADGRDIGLVSIRPNAPVQVTRIAPPGVEVRQGERVVSLGCDNGQTPTARSTHVTALDRYVGPPNIEAAGMPVEGRSGGGLFNHQGQLIGVCYAADEEHDEGLYAGLASIHAELDRLGLKDIYQTAAHTGGAQSPVQLASHNNPVPNVAAPNGTGPNVAAPSAAAPTETTPNMPRMMPAAGSAVANNPPAAPIASTSAAATLSPTEQAAMEEIQSRSAGAEVVCIIRPKDPGAKSEVIVLDNVSGEFVRQLTAGQRKSVAPQKLTSMQVRRAPTPPIYRVPTPRRTATPTERRDAAGWSGK